MGSGSTWAALGVYLAGGVVGFGLRSWLHHRVSGDNGLRYTPPAPGSPPWWSHLLAGGGIVLGGISPVLAATGALAPIAALHRPAVYAAGLVAAVVGFGGVFAAQQAMGRSWRIGVDLGERTSLVTGGVFALVRNPVYTALITAMAGMAGMVPSWPQLAALAAVFAGVELQVRTVEEPYLARMHGVAYPEYTAGVGRFLPGIGRAPIAAPAAGDGEGGAR